MANNINEKPILYNISLTNEDFGQICDALQECESVLFVCHQGPMTTKFLTS